MARKLRGFERILDAPALFAVAYGELASSIYFALGIVAAYALGLTPVVLLVTGLLFVTIGVALLVATAAAGGGVLGFLLGGLFIALGVGRLTLLRRTRR